jgi:hypothetical protein
MYDATKDTCVLEADGLPLSWLSEEEKSDGFIVATNETGMFLGSNHYSVQRLRAGGFAVVGFGR